MLWRHLLTPCVTLVPGCDSRALLSPVLPPSLCVEMAKVQTPQGKVGQAPVKKKINNAKPSKNVAKFYCVLCRRSYLKHEAQDHVHGMLHHRELETVLGKDSSHVCHACKASSMGLNEYAQHISTAQHQAKLRSLMMIKIKPVSLHKTLSKETLGQIMERNKRLKKEEKKAGRKKKKKEKQVAGQKRAEMLRGAKGKKPPVSKVAKLEKNKQVNTKVMQQEIQGRSNAVVQNKENKVSSLHKSLHQRDAAPQNQSGSLVCLSEEPSGQTWQYPSVQNQSTQSAQQHKYNDKFSVKIENSQTDRLGRRPYKTQGGATNKQKQQAWSTAPQNDYYDKQYDGEFTSDHLPDNGAIIFGRDQKESLGSSPSAQEGSAQTASANGTASAAPIRDVDVSAMLRQIRRALGVREPCRADREARKQSGEAGVRVTDHSSAQQARAEKEATPHASSAAAASEQSSQDDSPAPAAGVSPTTSSEPNLNITRKVRIAHKSVNGQGGKEAGLKPTMNTLLSLPGAKNTLSRREIHSETKRKKQERGKGMPRFGIELANPLSDQESSTQAKDNDAALSEGFHWESFPDGPSGSRCTSLPPPPNKDSQSDSPIQERPAAAQEGSSSSSPAAKAVSVKVEPKLDDDILRANGGASKRKHNVYDGISDMQPSGKKRKAKSNKEQGQMDQLLAVSLREDELSHSLQDLDESLVQARNTLQAAYTEVQRLLLMRQQCTAEVNSLRAQRIEILQGMQGGYTAAEKATTSSAGAPAAVHPRHSPLPSLAFPTSSRQQPSPLYPASSISPLALPTMPVKQEIFQPATAGQSSQFTKTVSDTLQVPANQPVPLFPSDLLPSLLLPSPGLAPPTTAVTSLKLERSASAGTNSFPESPACQQTATLAGGETQWSDSDSEEEVGGMPASTFVPQRGETASAAAPDAAADGGNESDASVEMMEPCSVVIDIDESDCEDAPNVPVLQEPPQKSVSVEFNSSSSQTFQQNDIERKCQPPLVPIKDTGVSLERVDVIEDEEPCVGTFYQHSGPVHGLQVHGGRLYTCSGDNTARAYNLTTRECRAVFEGHTNKVNCLLVSSVPNMLPRLYTGSSDQTIRCHSIKTTKCLDQISLMDRVLCLHIAWNILYAGLANGAVASCDLKTLKHLDMFECHGPRGVSCLGTSQEGARRVLLVGSYDSSISVRDAKSGLLLRSLQGHTKTVLCMKVVNDLVFSGSSDTFVHAHNIHTGELVRIYKGHDHAVTSIVILGKVMVTACLDKLVRVYELQSHDRLQVYGGHSDMVMCMAVHKSVVYTGCYDGSVQAVKLNLMKNYRCWWQNCALIFGNAEHLLQHLVRDHCNLNLQAVKCRWRGCSTFFGTQQSVQQNLPEHMQSHVENDSKVQP
ncbi:zinc finger protein 106 isoform X2 [Cebidichthys violaceus]|uniref:zinc finger protein 106 isoform X2 n=1 Tax=Cebidichthys violaceus TaxID=271503 RepID=UPI0035C95115